MTRTSKQERDFQSKVTALQDIHICAAEALVNRSAKTVGELESLCDSFLRRFDGRKDKPDKIRNLMGVFRLTEEDVLRVLVRVKEEV